MVASDQAGKCLGGTCVAGRPVAPCPRERAPVARRGRQRGGLQQLVGDQERDATATRSPATGAEPARDLRVCPVAARRCDGAGAVDDARPHTNHAAPAARATTDGGRTRGATAPARAPGQQYKRVAARKNPRRPGEEVLEPAGCGGGCDCGRGPACLAAPTVAPVAS